MPLSAKQVLHAKPGRHSDGSGLYLLVRPSGSRSWVLRVQHEGRRRDFGLGSFNADSANGDIPLQVRTSLTLAQAREKARLARELAKAGLNPTAAWRLENRKAPTFADAAEEYHSQVSKSWRNGKHGDQWITTLKTYAFPVIGDLPIDEIDARSIQQVLTPIWLTKAETARRVRQRIGAVLDYAHGRGWRDMESPMRAVQHLMGGIKQPRGSNFAAMPYKALPGFMTSLRSDDISIGRLALQFLILTAARSGEVRKARWRDIDLSAKEWRLPPETTKTGKLHIVPLVPATVAILRQAKSLGNSADDELIFPGMSGMMSDATLGKVLRTAAGRDFTVHGFRSSFRDWAAETGYADSWAEAALAHTTHCGHSAHMWP